jgi:Ca2+-binding EF-hand superfamily protein
MKRTVIAAASLALLGAASLAGLALAQPPGAPHAPGPQGFGLVAFDTNADGKISRAELDTAQRTRFEAIDANRDGFATPEEFKAAHEKDRAAHHAQMVDSRFAALDKDGNQTISKAEFSTGMLPPDGAQPGPGRGGPGRADRGPGGPGREHRMSGPGGEHGMDRGPQGADGKRGRIGPDADGDGKASLAEFSSRAVEGFNRADTNKDGVVTIAELQAARPSRP